MMTKELEAIRDDKLRIGLLGLKRLFEANAKKMTKDEITAFDFTFMNITNALLELQAIKEAEPSEAIMCFKRLSNVYNLYDEIEGEYFETTEESKVIWLALLKAEKLEKFKEIVITHNVRIADIKYCNSAEEYNEEWDDDFTNEEFDLLKEMLE